MKSFLVLLCLVTAATVVAAEPQGDAAPGGPTAAPALRVREVRFAGDDGFAPDPLQKALEALDTLRVIPGIWTRRPLYTAAAVDADLARLRSFYLSNGYFDAQVAAGDVTVEGRDVTLTLDVRSGAKYGIRHIRTEGLGDGNGDIAADSTGGFPVDALCQRLLAARRVAESAGRIDFLAALEISDT